MIRSDPGGGKKDGQPRKAKARQLVGHLAPRPSWHSLRPRGKRETRDRCISWVSKKGGRKIGWVGRVARTFMSSLLGGKGDGHRARTKVATEQRAQLLRRLAWGVAAALRKEHGGHLPRVKTAATPPGGQRAKIRGDLLGGGCRQALTGGKVLARGKVSGGSARLF